MNVLILCFLLFLKTGIVSSVIVIQSETFRTFVAGENVTMVCHIEDFYENYYSWFKQSPGEAPSCIVTLYSGTAPMLHGDFQQDKRFKAEKKGTQFTLTILDTKEADTGIYYCGARDYVIVVFSDGIFLKYEGPTIEHFQYYINALTSPNQTEKTQNLKDPFHVSDSVALQCTVLTGRCAGHHSVYWFRYESGESHPGIIYTHGDSSSQCTKSSETDSLTKSCVYKLPKKNLSLSDAGTYYCAIAACGEILFKKGTRLETTEHNLQSIELYWKVIALAVSNAVCLIVIVALLCTRTKKRKVSTSKRPENLSSASSSNSPVNENVQREDLSYTAINFPARKFKRRETEKDETTNVLYSSVSGLN